MKKFTAPEGPYHPIENSLENLEGRITKQLEGPPQISRSRKITPIKCGICGNSCKTGYSNEYMTISAEAVWGYDSKKDYEYWTAQISVCEKCVDKHLAPLIKFKKQKYDEVAIEGNPMIVLPK
ncbi:MAG: hypothetical protein US50_C0034G0008 [Candidatus Nomurabacteria bacterium GW2011_GWB1_37_5]|uniref:Uncharacterized protein n=1 Tax=Candidatus Nomurabacteria bacterium GW2011_GWB1_37_5 TaxID=1618742 RepID=A0A0G0GXU9_9BACT|nr:MAG: hypothetical protein US50_C0034G0008 [Candidatus Nomurabacteria bacterium GW2011_GWB1_37_5]